MNKKILYRVFRTLFAKALLFLFIVSINSVSFSQNATKDPDSTYYHKNAIKGFALVIPPPFFSAGLSTGYERNISRHSTLELCVFYYFYTDGMELKHHSVGVMPAYKYYTISKKKGLNNFWFSGYLSFIYETHKHTESDDNIRHSTYYYGIGLSVGRRMFLTKEKNIFIDIGFGGSINIYSYEQKSSENVWTGMLLPRPIIQIGGKF